MADQGQWFKLWCSALTDGELASLDVADFGRWARLGAYVRQHGQDGHVRLRWSPLLQALFQVPDLAALGVCFTRLPGVILTPEPAPVPGETVLSVSFRNWRKYQTDFSTFRVRAHRDKVKRLRGEEKRGEEMRGEIPPVAPPVAPPVDLDSEDPIEWGEPGCLLRLYNAATPPECVAVDTASPGLFALERNALAKFPKRAWWEETFAQVHRSRWLRGLVKPREGHIQPFVVDLVWILGVDDCGVERAVLVHDGRYRDR